MSGETELFQNDKGITIKIDRSKDDNLTDFGKATLKDRYLGQNESFQDLFVRELACMQMTIYRSKNLQLHKQSWFMPATPVLSNGGTERFAYFLFFKRSQRQS